MKNKKLLILMVLFILFLTGLTVTVAKDTTNVTTDNQYENINEILLCTLWYV